MKLLHKRVAQITRMPDCIYTNTILKIWKTYYEFMRIRMKYLKKNYLLL